MALGEAGVGGAAVGSDGVGRSLPRVTLLMGSAVFTARPQVARLTVLATPYDVF